jgi:primosomal protein N' (replication factor Y)
MRTIGEVFRGAIHLLFLLESETIISQKKDSDVVVSELSDDEYLILMLCNNRVL